MDMSTITAALVDDLGALQADIARLTKRADAIKNSLKDAGAGRYEGVLYDASVSVADRETVAWKELVAHLEGLYGFEVKSNTLTKFTKTSEVATVRVVGRVA